MKNILITGITGFVGSHLADHLLKEKENKIFTIITRKGNLDLDIKNETIYNKIIDSIYVISNSLNQIEKAELRKNDLYEKFKKLDSQDATFSIFATNSFSNPNISLVSKFVLYSPR